MNSPDFTARANPKDKEKTGTEIEVAISKDGCRANSSVT